MKALLSALFFLIIFSEAEARGRVITSKARVATSQSTKYRPILTSTNRYNQIVRPASSRVIRSGSTLGMNRPSGVVRTLKPVNSPMVGMFFMPFWNLDITVDGKQKTVNWFWGCLKESWITDCLFTKSPLWGPNGRDYSGETRPDMSLKEPLRGFYEPNDQKVIAEQIAEMKGHGVDYLIYDWFWGRHYYHDLSLYYPAQWQTSPLASSEYGLRPDRRDGVTVSNLLRIRVPGMELHADQLHTIVNTLESLPPEERIRFALNWCDDSYDGWMNWLKAGQVGSGTLDKLPPWYIASNMPEEKHSKELFLRVHEKMVNLWVDQYFSKSFYLKDDSGRPIVYHMYNDNTMAWASAYGITIRNLVDLSNKVARERGLPGIKFISVGSENGSTNPTEVQNGYGMKTRWTPKYADQTLWFQGGSDSSFVSRLDYTKKVMNEGYEGLSAYVYYSYTQPNNALSFNTSYDLFIQNYKNNWAYWQSQLGSLPKFELHVPTSVGWDMSPAGGYYYDKSGKASFKAMDIGHLPVDKYKHLLESAKAVPGTKYVTLCCWNEYVEGNILEPTKGTGTNYLEAIKDTFMLRDSRVRRPIIYRPYTAPAPSVLSPQGTRPTRRSY